MPGARPCEADTKAGRPCSNRAVDNEPYCFMHLPDGHPSGHRWPKSVHGSHGPSTYTTALAVAEVMGAGPTEDLNPRETYQVQKATARRVQELAADRVDAVFALWDEIMANPLEAGATRASVGNMLLDRAAGKPGQHHEVSVGVADWLASPTDVTDDDDVIDQE